MTGIYKIKNKLNNMVYIGESLNIEERWNRHKQDLREGKHHSYKLQQDYNLCGEDNFTYEVIEEIDSNLKVGVRQLLCLIYEDKYIKQYNSVERGYNLEYTLQRVLDGKRGVFSEKEIKDSHIKMLENMIINLKRNNGIYISSKRANKRKNNNISCLFQIRNIVLDKSYISRSKNPDNILEDIAKKLKRNKYSNRGLQSDFNKYKIDNFEFSIIEMSDDMDYILKREKEILTQLSENSKLYNIDIIL